MVLDCRGTGCGNVEAVTGNPGLHLGARFPVLDCVEEMEAGAPLNADDTSPESDSDAGFVVHVVAERGQSFVQEVLPGEFDTAVDE